MSSQREPSPRPDPDSTHLRRRADGEGLESCMVDVGEKPATRRRAVARARLWFPPGALARALAGEGPKGPIVEVARVAGILAAKRTGELIPMCHPLALTHVEIEIAERDDQQLEILCRTATVGPTGVEMEAMSGAAVCALTVYDMTKGIDRGIRLDRLELVEKSGGKSGHWTAPDWSGSEEPGDRGRG